MDIRCTRLRIALHVVFVSRGTLGLPRFGVWANSSVFAGPKRMVPGQVWMMDNFREQQLLLHLYLIHSHLERPPNPVPEIFNSCLGYFFPYTSHREWLKLYRQLYRMCHEIVVDLHSFFDLLWHSPQYCETQANI